MKIEAGYLAAAILFGGAVSSAAAQAYEIGAGDIVNVSVRGQDEFSGDFAVDGDGMLEYPILGPVKASEMTREELARKLTTLLADGYLKSPDVSVSIKEFWSRRVFVTGQVEAPGAYGLKGDRSLLGLLNEIGGPTDSAGHEVIVVRPPGPAATPQPREPDANDGSETASPSEVEAGPTEEQATPETPDRGLYPNEVPGSQIFKVALEELLSGNPEGNVVLEPGDTVFFPRAANIYVTGFVARPGALRYQPRTTVFQAVNQAGGISSRGSRKIRIIRLIDGEHQEFRAKMTDLVRPEDTIVVPERFF